jgi:WD40 repeat protein
MTTNVPGTDPLEYRTDVFDAATRQPVTTVPGHPFKFGPNGLLATQLPDLSSAIWRIQATGAVERARLPVPATVPRDDYYGERYQFSANSALLAARFSNQVVVWSLATSSNPQIVTSRSWGRLGFAGQILITGVDPEGVLECWDAADGAALRRVEGIHVGRGATMGPLSFDGRTLATLRQGEVELWDLVSRTRVKGFPHAVPSLGPLALAPDGRTLVGGDVDGRVHFWNIASGTIIATIPAHIASCRSISFSFRSG